MHKKLAIIPARGGSKRIPRKNCKDFLGKPIIAYSIETAIHSKLFDEVMVSTDDDEIAEIAKAYGASVPFKRSEKAASDTATTYEVIEEVLLSYAGIGKTFQYACCIYATAPFVTAEKLNTAYMRLDKNQYDVVFPVMQYSFPIQRALRLSEGKAQMIQPENVIVRSQDLEPTYHDAGQFYWCNVDAVLKKKSIVTDHTGVIKIPELEGQDIDNILDWKLAELKYQMQKD